MKERIQTILDQYYRKNDSKVKELSVLDSSPDLEIVCIRWRDGDRTITVKSILQDNGLLLTELR